MLREGAHFVFEGTLVLGYLEIRLKSSACMFIKDNLVYTLGFNDTAANFANNVKLFEDSVNSFILK